MDEVMHKPTVFFSHSSKDAASLARLKDLFVHKTGGAIDVFLSSDGQSIPLGRNWVHRIQQALDEAKLMVVFVTPNSVASQWLYFESGYAYSKNLRVVPVGFKGLDLSTVKAPLGLLQGFNITSRDSLGNLISLVNEAFGHSHVPTFSDEEYLEIVSQDQSPAAQSLGQLGEYVDEITIHVSDSDLRKNSDKIREEICAVLGDKGVRVQKQERDLYLSALTISFEADPRRISQAVLFRIDPGLFHSNVPLLTELLRLARHEIRGTRLILDFHEDVEGLDPHHKISARLHGTPVTLDENSGFAYRDVTFNCWHHRINFQAVGYQIQITLNTDCIPVEQVREVLDLLWTRHVVHPRFGGPSTLA
ncbi:MAG: toll/interleukin-1 receptor domain-containing protein [Sedimentisphaerales bacterium]|nr:toll/interleukin-1 receptor domain-containing protein [Sedimentisphaerales bacterium]